MFFFQSTLMFYFSQWYPPLQNERGFYIHQSSIKISIVGFIIIGYVLILLHASPYSSKTCSLGFNPKCKYYIGFCNVVGGHFISCNYFFAMNGKLFAKCNTCS
jgi:hypothetical protein